MNRFVPVKRSRPERCEHPAGFTLLEVIVTFTILSLVVVMILGALRLGLSSWERGEAKAEQYQVRRIVLDLLSQQIRSAYPYRVKSTRAEPDYLAFMGTADNLRFVSTFSLKAKRSEGLVVVIYQVEEGRVRGKNLKVFEKRLLTNEFMEEAPKEDEFLILLEGIDDVRFEFFQEGERDDEEGEWIESWDGKEKTNLPRQVRVVTRWRGKMDEEGTLLPTLISLPAYQYDQRVIARSRVRPRSIRPR